MCWARKCCVFLNLDVGCILIGIISLVFTTALSVTSLVLLILEAHDEALHSNSGTTTLQQMFPAVNLTFSRTVIRSVMYMSVTFGVAGMPSSVLLMRGVNKNKPGYILCYFSYGIMVTIVVQLCALLLLLHTHWIASFVLFVIGMFYIHLLVVVHTVYEMMQRGKSFGSNPHATLDSEPFIEDP